MESITAINLLDNRHKNSSFLFPGTKRELLYQKYIDKLITNPDLNRTLVSFQGNKVAAFYRWLKYKEAFSSNFVSYILERHKPKNISNPCVLDPFAGIGTTLTTAAKEGWKATGIELMPIGVHAIYARLKADIIKINSFQYYLNQLIKSSLCPFQSNFYRFSHLRITKNAYPKETEQMLSAYISFLNSIKNEDVRFLFWFACLSILEEISYTRKDGQYLRWDFRSGRELKSSFNKGTICDFKTAITRKLRLMLEDIKKRNGDTLVNNIEIIEGSCLDELPKLKDSSFHLVITSPPYCNRYDYTRTYALELAFLGHDEEGIKNLRQNLLSATVENKTKIDQLAQKYYFLNQKAYYLASLESFSNQKALNEILDLLYDAREKGRLNNKNIPNLIENYFFEMNIVIHQLSRILAPGGRIVMVNDNVRYNSEEIPVDLILSDFATQAGLLVDHIWVLPRGKGNSSQQMGLHGRKELRKCVYVWSKPF